MTKDFDIVFLIDGKNVGGSVISVVDGKLLTQAAEDKFYAVLRKNEKSLIEDAELDERDELIEKLTYEQEEKLKEEHAKDYHGLDDDMGDAYEDWLSELSLSDLKEIIK